MTEDSTGSVVAVLEKYLAYLKLQRRRYTWLLHARPSQLLPEGDTWRIWLILAGRGFGKTRTGAESIRAWVQNKTCKRIALVGETLRDVTDVMVKGTSGLLAVHPPHERPTFIPSQHKMIWPSGAEALMFSSEAYEKLRGPQFDGAWVDELAKFSYAQETWDQLMFGLRLGENPRVIVTTTPRPLPLLRDIMRDPFTITTKGTTYENEKNLSQNFIRYLMEKYENTRLGAQEIYASILDDIKCALWQRGLLCYETPSLPLGRIVIAVDPAASAHAGSDETGIIVAGMSKDGTKSYILDDLSGTYSPYEWAEKVAKAYLDYKADRVVAEVNMGGAMVQQILRQSMPHISYRAVHATRGKERRAEPIVALYEQKRVYHARPFEKLENQMCQYVPHLSKGSPDRMDALVWALTDLFQHRPTDYRVWSS